MGGISRTTPAALGGWSRLLCNQKAVSPEFPDNNRAAGPQHAARHFADCGSGPDTQQRTVTAITMSNEPLGMEAPQRSLRATRRIRLRRWRAGARHRASRGRYPGRLRSISKTRLPGPLPASTQRAHPCCFARSNPPQDYRLNVPNPANSVVRRFGSVFARQPAGA